MNSMFWFNILKKPKLNIGIEGVGLLDLSNVPDEEERCKPKYMRWVEKIKSFIATETSERRQKPLPLKQIYFDFPAEELEDKEYCRIMESNWNENHIYGQYSSAGKYHYYYDSFVLDDSFSHIVEDFDSVVIKLIWDRKVQNWDTIRFSIMSELFKILNSGGN